MKIFSFTVLQLPLWGSKNSFYLDTLSKEASATVTEEGITKRKSVNEELNSAKKIEYIDYDVKFFKDVHFYLYTRNNSKTEELFINDTKSIRQSNYNIIRPTKLVTHGWDNSYRDLSVQLVKNGKYFQISISRKVLFDNLFFSLDFQ